MMTEGIIIALIAAGGALIGNLIALSVSRGKERESRAVRDAQLDMRLDSIERKLDIHNGYAERFAEIQTDIAVIKTKMGGGK